MKPISKRTIALLERQHKRERMVLLVGLLCALSGIVALIVSVAVR